MGVNKEGLRLEEERKRAHHEGTKGTKARKIRKDYKEVQKEIQKLDADFADYADNTERNTEYSPRRHEGHEVDKEG